MSEFIERWACAQCRDGKEECEEEGEDVEGGGAHGKKKKVIKLVN